MLALPHCVSLGLALGLGLSLGVLTSACNERAVGAGGCYPACDSIDAAPAMDPSGQYPAYVVGTPVAGGSCGSCDTPGVDPALQASVDAFCPAGDGVWEPRCSYEESGFCVYNAVVYGASCGVDDN